jgi:hypothetical protein
MVVAAIVGYLVQVGLMSFLYTVLWVERRELRMAWMGGEGGEEVDGGGELGGEEATAVVGDGDAGVNDGGGGGVAERGVDVDNDDAAGARIGDPNANVVRPIAGAPAAPPAGGMIRRGPDNGGLLHDVQCLILSFFLSLIPAWRPTEAVEGV